MKVKHIESICFFERSILNSDLFYHSTDLISAANLTIKNILPDDQYHFLP